MKKSLMMVIAMVISTFAFAQHTKGKHDGEKKIDNMKAALSLDDNQYATIKGIEKKYASQYASIKKDSSLTKEKKKASIHSVRDEQNKEINSVLTPAQQTKWKTYRAEQKSKRKETKQKAVEQRDAKMKEALSLSDEQFVKMKNANTDLKDKMHAVNKDGKRDKAASQKIKADHEADVKTILSAQQFEQWKTYRAEMKDKRKHKHH